MSIHGRTGWMSKNATSTDEEKQKKALETLITDNTDWYTEVDLKRFSGHTSLRSLERYIADNREAAKRKARVWERRQGVERNYRATNRRDRLSAEEAHTDGA